MRHTSAINLLKKELDTLTSEMLPIEQEIASLSFKLEEMKFAQTELIESIKELGAASVDYTDNRSTN